MTFRNNYWYLNRERQTSRRPLAQTEELQIKHSHSVHLTSKQTFCQLTNVSNLSAKKKKKHSPSIKLQMKHALFLTPSSQARTYHADSDRTLSPGWVRSPFSASSRPLFVVPSCAWDCSHVDADRAAAAASRRGPGLPFLLPLLHVSLLRGGVAKELPGAVDQR